MMLPWWEMRLMLTLTTGYSLQESRHRRRPPARPRRLRPNRPAELVAESICSAPYEKIPPLDTEYVHSKPEILGSLAECKARFMSCDERSGADNEWYQSTTIKT